MIFLETSFLVALFVSKTEQHQLAKNVMDKIEDRIKVISEMTIYETLTVLRKFNQTDDYLKEIYDYLTGLYVFEDVIYYKEALKYTFINKIGFFDNLSYVVMKNNDINEIVSFDKDFYQLEDITVIDR